MSAPLAARLVTRIREHGPITFAEYMEAALYDPAGGFFSRAPVGKDFVTSAHVSPAFAVLLTRALAACYQALGDPERFTVVDLGAGDGMLAKSLKSIPDVNVVAVERSARARAKLKGVRSVASIDDLGPFTGVVIANELFDNVPFHRLRPVDGAMREIFVGHDGTGFVEVEGEPTVGAPAIDDQERPVSPASAELVARVAKVLERGYVIAIDYGFGAGEEPEPVRAYAQHRYSDDVLREPGAHDVTGPVDFDALAAAARAAGLDVLGPVTQREFLMALGYREVLARMRAQQQHAEQRKSWRAAIDAFGARGDASMLVDEAGLGGFKVIGFATKGLPALRALQKNPSGLGR